MKEGGPRRRGGGPLTGTVVSTTEEAQGRRDPHEGHLPQSGGVSVGPRERASLYSGLI